MNPKSTWIRLQYYDPALGTDILYAQVTLSEATISEEQDIYELLHMLTNKLYTQIERHITG